MKYEIEVREKSSVWGWVVFFIILALIGAGAGAH
jgi:hypothetical protein